MQLYPSESLCKQKPLAGFCKDSNTGQKSKALFFQMKMCCHNVSKTSECAQQSLILLVINIVKSLYFIYSFGVYGNKSFVMKNLYLLNVCVCLDVFVNKKCVCIYI